MKFLVLSLLLLSGLVQADTTALETLLYDGSQDTQSVRLSTEKTKTEYRQIPVRTICYRTELRYRCTSTGPVCRNVCNPSGCRTMCHPGRRVCRNVPVQVSYPCTRIETRPVQVHDYFVETDVIFEFSKVQSPELVNEKLTMQMTGENSSLTAEGSKNYFLLLDNRRRSERREGGVKYISLVYKVRVIPAAQAKSVLANGIQNVTLRNGVLSFSLGNGFNLDDFVQNIKLFKNYRLGRDKLILDRPLNTSEIDVVSTASASDVTIDLNQLGVSLPRKLRVILDTEYKINKDKILNKGEIETETSANWVFR